MIQPPPGWPSGEPHDPHGTWQQPPVGGWPQQQPPAGGWPQQPPAGGWPQQQSAPGAWPVQQQPAAPGSWPQQPAAPGAWPQQPDPGPSGWNIPQPQQGQPTGPWEPLGPPGYGPPPRPRSRGKIIASAAVIVALAGGGVATYVAFSDRNSTGAGSPKQAVQSIVTDINKSDLVGVLDHLAPGERDALSHPTLDAIKELKRLKVLQQGADPSKVSGVKFEVKGLTFAGKTITINDHVQIVQLTGGTLDVAADASKVPFTHDFIASVFPHGLPSQSNGTTHIDIGKVVRGQHDEPVRIATQKVGGKWYPSILYTIADGAAQHRTPAGSDAIPAVGASSPEDAVRRIVNALLDADVTAAVKLLSPDELAVMHDYGGMFLRDAGRYQAPNVKIKDLQLKTKKVSGGATRVLLSRITVSNRNGDETSIKIDGSCLDVTTRAQHQHLCTTELVKGILDFVNAFDVELTPPQRQAIDHLLTGLTQVGLDTTQTGGKWYVNPVRSWLDVSTSVMSGLQGNDLLELLGFFAKLGN